MIDFTTLALAFIGFVCLVAVLLLWASRGGDERGDR